MTRSWPWAGAHREADAELLPEAPQTRGAAPAASERHCPVGPASVGGGAGNWEERRDERLARVALNAVTEPADPRLARLLDTLGPEDLYERLREDVDLSGAPSEIAARLAALTPERILEQAHERGIRFLIPGDAEWPDGMSDLHRVEPLNGLTGAPVGLWVRGPASLAAACGSAVAVVGSRSATSYGVSVAADLAAHVAAEQLTVVSGAAFGIDQAAHHGALGARGATVAVLACGVDRAYPTAHRALLEHLAGTSVVVSELRPGCSPTRVRFLSRNRLIAAMTSGTVVVEAAVRSGALNTANWAARMQRVVMGVPGPVTSAPSVGVHELVRAGAATLVAHGEHILELVGRPGEHLVPPAREPVRPGDRLGSTERRVLDAVPLVTPAPTASIARTAAVSTAAVEHALSRLHSTGWVLGDGARWRRAPDSPAGPG